MSLYKDKLANKSYLTNTVSYSNMRGVTDFGNVGQFNYYESGYSFLFVLKIPTFLLYAAVGGSGNELNGFGKMLEKYLHILEYEFKGLDGLDNITSDTLEVSDGISSINLINKVTQQSQATVSMRYTERSGSIITGVHEAFLKGIRDPRTQGKTYLGYLGGGVTKTNEQGEKIPNSGNMPGTITIGNKTFTAFSLDKPGFEHEVFTFLYVVTDNTSKNVERAFLLVAAQPTSSQFDIYNSEKGTIETKEITVEFNCFPIENKNVNNIAINLMKALHESSEFTVDSDKYEYTYDAENAVGTDSTKGATKINESTSFNIDSLKN